MSVEVTEKLASAALEINIFNQDQEKSLVQYILKCAGHYYGLSITELRQLAYQLSKKIDVCPEGWEDEMMAPRHWYYKFMKRHPQLVLRTPEQTSMNRAKAFCKSNVDLFFQNFNSVLTSEHDIMATNIFNMDESGFSTVPSKIGKVIALKGMRRVGKMEAAERGTMVTMALTVSAAGNSLPPFFLFPRKKLQSSFLDSVSSGTVGYANGSGWMCQPEFVHYMRHFIAFAKPSLASPVILLMDNHCSHLSVEAIDLAIENGVHIVTFPPHCSHRLQPLDVSVFGPVKAYYKSQCSAWQKNNANKGMKTQNGGDEPQINGVSNGHHSSSSSRHKSSSKDKNRDKERDRDHKSSNSSSSSKHKSSSRDKDKHGSSSSSSRDKNRDKDKEGSSSSSSKHHSSSSNSRDKDKDKYKSSSSSSHQKSSSSSSSSKDKERSEHKDKEHEKDRDRKEGSSSSSSNKDKDRHHKSSSSSSSSRDKDKDRHHKSSSSSSSKSKHSSSNSSSSKSSSKDKPREKFIDGDFVKPEPILQILSNPQENGFETDPLAMDVKSSQLIKNNNEESCSGFDKQKDDDKSAVKVVNTSLHNISQASSCDYSMSQFKEDEPPFVIKEEAPYDDDSPIFKQEEITIEDDDEDDVPISKRKANARKTAINEDEDDVPLAKRKMKEEIESDEDVPLLSRKKSKKESKKDKEKTKDKKKKRQIKEEQEDDYEVARPTKKRSKNAAPAYSQVKQEKASPTKGVKKEKKEDEHEVWRWWEEEKRADGVKWNTLEHKGPVFAPLYEPLPKNVRFFYDGKEMRLSEETEEAATFYAKMLNHDYCTKDIFNDNFFKDFRKTMNSKERETIKDFKKCNFQEMFQYFTAESEKRKNSTKEQKLAKKLENEALIKEYGFCIIDGHKEKIGNFRLEPPGLFRGRGEHPKMGMIKRRIQAGDVSINCGKASKIPEPPKGHRWKEVRHDNTVTWLASWIENVQGQVKYIMLNPSSKLKGEKDHVKYETARRLAKSIDKIRSTYRDEWKSKEMRVRQRAVALYFIDKLALRAGNEKDEDQADTVGCCSLRVEHIQLHKQLNGKENVVVFDFLGKDSIRYYNEVEVEKRVFKNLELFMENKKQGDDLFDRLNTTVLNEHLKELMDGLTAKVFRTYNASITLQNQLNLLTEDNMTIPEKLLAYNRANRAVAVLCNHQRAVPKGHEKSMENLKEKMRSKREMIDDAESEYHDLKKAAKRGSVKEKIMADKKGKLLERLKDQLKKLELQETDRDENKTIALGTSKLNYLDPRISVAWCKKHEVPIEKIFNKTQRDKFLWAIHMADENYVF